MWFTKALRIGSIESIIRTCSIKRLLRDSDITERTDVLMSVCVRCLVSHTPSSLICTAVSCCWTCQIYMTDIGKFCSGGCSQQPTRRRFRQKRKESEGLYSTPRCRQKTEDARCRICGNVRKQILQMCRRGGSRDFLVMLWFLLENSILELLPCWINWSKSSCFETW